MLAARFESLRQLCRGASRILKSKESKDVSCSWLPISLLLNLMTAKLEWGWRPNPCNSASAKNDTAVALNREDPYI